MRVWLWLWFIPGYVWSYIRDEMVTIKISLYLIYNRIKCAKFAECVARKIEMEKVAMILMFGLL